jgi:hypothetical protein
MTRLSFVISILVLPFTFHSIQAQPGETKTGTATISGWVTLKGEPARAVEVILVTEIRWSGNAPRARTDENGRFLVRRGAASISGIVVIEGTNDQKALAKLSQVSLYATVILAAPKTGERVEMPPVQINADGSFRMGGLPAGKAGIWRWSRSDELTIARIERDGAPTGERIEIAAGEQVTGVRVVFLYGALTLRGEMKVVGGTLPADCRGDVIALRVDQNAKYSQRAWTVTLTPVAADLRTISRGSQNRTSTDEDGNFKFTGLAPRAYSVTASSVKGYAPSPVPFSERQDSGWRHIGDNVTIIMMKGGAITGRVTNALGEPVIGVQVNAAMARGAERSQDRGGSGNHRFTDDRGVYRLYGLSPGTYIVFTRKSFDPFPSPYDNDGPTYYPSSTRETAAEVTVTSGGEASGIDIGYRGDRGHAVSGLISFSGKVNNSI